MNIFGITKRLFQLHTQYTSIKKLSKEVHLRFRFPDQDTRLKQKPTIHRFSGKFKRICQPSPPVGTLNTPVESFRRHPTKTGFTSLCKIHKCYNEPVVRYHGYPGNKFKSIQPHVSNWRWYAVTKKPTETGGVKDDLDRLGPRSKDSLFDKQKKPRSLEEIKRMLKEKYHWKEPMDKDRKT